MIIEGLPGRHLTYCTNIHPGESWDAVLGNIRTHVLEVKRRISPDAPFGVGLRLSAAAARGLAVPEALAEFQSFLGASGLYVFTINGFPHGTFSGAVVKEQVYRPDWLEDERVRYSDQLARLLAALLPPGLDGSVSTVPGCFLGRGALADAGATIAANLRRHALALWRLRATTGRTVALRWSPNLAAPWRPPTRRWRSSTPSSSPARRCGPSPMSRAWRQLTPKKRCAVTWGSAWTPATRRSSSRTRRGRWGGFSKLASAS